MPRGEFDIFLKDRVTISISKTTNAPAQHAGAGALAHV
jgi:hypothetical protein